MIPLWKGFSVEKMRVAHRRYWVLADGGPEFGELFTNTLQQDGSWHQVTAPHSPWQNGMCERQGGVGVLFGYFFCIFGF